MLLAVKIARTGGSFTYAEAKETEEQLALVEAFTNSLPQGYVKSKLRDDVVPMLRTQVAERR